ncbi:16S rRNA (uracil(1498)-N(3))-methyltransferase [Patescibacteria group bacterium]|nr:16S rRNA (uracil(1498)-N(3))-methyltransferase [Patescibacteria group bacterium]
MRLHRFYAEKEIGNDTEIELSSAELANQIRRVFRLGIGDSIIVFNGTGFDYECKIDSFGSGDKIKSDSYIKLIVNSVSRSRWNCERKIYLCAALVKKDNFEWIAEKATELGVSDVIPVIAEHSEKKSVNESRLKKIAIEASEQSGRGDVPMIHEIMGVNDAVEFVKSRMGAAVLAFHTEGERFEHGSSSDKTKPLAVFIGPEGGWSPAEIDMFHKERILVVQLGPQILRAETAVIAALSQVVFV